jgi:hypothetical protein
MATNMYVIYDSETGDVVELHVEEAGLRSEPDEVLEVAGLAGDKRYAVLEVPDRRPPERAFRIENGAIRELDDEGSTGMGGAMPGSAEAFGARRYSREPPSSSD